MNSLLHLSTRAAYRLFRIAHKLDTTTFLRRRRFVTFVQF